MSHIKKCCGVVKDCKKEFLFLRHKLINEVDDLLSVWRTRKIHFKEYGAFVEKLKE